MRSVMGSQVNRLWLSAAWSTGTAPHAANMAAHSHAHRRAIAGRCSRGRRTEEDGGGRRREEVRKGGGRAAGGSFSGPSPSSSAHGPTRLKRRAAPITGYGHRRVTRAPSWASLKPTCARPLAAPPRAASPYTLPGPPRARLPGLKPPGRGRTASRGGQKRRLVPPGRRYRGSLTGHRRPDGDPPRGGGGAAEARRKRGGGAAARSTSSLSSFWPASSFSSSFCAFPPFEEEQASSPGALGLVASPCQPHDESMIHVFMSAG
ncbi:hypothetical protein EYF80_058952 [Liparis tanakae]|uniref:Uncharacterized protein n=1 Tax=Liparis tanakae TaxID=230148 RepID=A0A4Z2EPL6_9TELE|nr:hypothetical protein EYF80_058952 [Liparis tanakae]